MTVTQLKNVNEAPDADVVAVLEDALAMARSGELRSIALAGELTGHRTFTAFETDDTLKTIALLSFLHFTVCARKCECSED